MIWVSVKLSHRRIILGACYRPPNAPATFVTELHDAINIVITRYPSFPVFVLGDFNYPGINWSPPIPFPSQALSINQQFLDLCVHFNLTQMVSKPTRITAATATILDLVFTTCPDLCYEIIHMPKLSDHALLNFSINLPVQKVTRRTKIISNYNNADFTRINQELDSFLSTFLNGFDERTVESNWTLFKNQVAHLSNRFIPVRGISYNPKAPWYNHNIRRLANRKKRFYRLAKKTDSECRWSQYHAAAEEYVSAIKNAKTNFLTNTLPDMLRNNPKKFWSVINPHERTTIALTDSNSEPIPECDCASVLNNAFSTCFSRTFTCDTSQIRSYDYIPMYPVLIDTNGICKIIDSIKTSSAFGIDCINPKFLKSTKQCCSIMLSKIFQQSLDVGELPSDWKIGKVVAAFKSGDRHSPFNYRPISITSVPCKILEHILFSNIANFLESNSFFHPAQHGFRKTFSCETQLLLFTHKLHSILDRSCFADCIFLDFAKAFDKVSHRLLLLKLRNLGLDTNTLKWIENFLTNRRQFVVANEASSSFEPVLSGVPQGTVLGPLLFLIYINDLPNCISSPVHLFADDCVLFREIITINDTHALQDDINAISSWCDKWQMTLNVDKCKSMRICRGATNPFSYHLNGTPLQSVSSYKYLGLHITSDLSWKVHIEFIVNKANRMLGYLKRNFHSAPSSVKLHFYKSIVRSQLEYASSIWDPSTETLTHLLEMVQNNSARFINSNYHRTTSVTTMKHNLGLPLLSSRRKIARLCLFHKVFFHSTLRDCLITSPPYVSSRLDHTRKVGVISCITKAFFNSFIPRTSKDWNHLPRDIVEINDVNLFRSALCSVT